MSEIVIRIDTDKCTKQCLECVIQSECKDKQEFYRKLDINALSGMSRAGIELSMVIMHEDCCNLQNALISSISFLKQYWTSEEKKEMQKHLEKLKMQKLLD